MTIFKKLWILKGILFVAILICSFEGYGQSSRKTIKTLLKSPDVDLDVLKCDRDWEDIVSYATILQVDNHYVMYYRAVSFSHTPHYAYCYAVSDDGIHWEKPNLNIVTFNGSTENNIISYNIDGVSVTCANGTYWMIADRMYDKQGNTIRGLNLFKSTDGIHFEKDDRLKIPFFCDSQNEILWDESSKTFKLYLRSWYKSEVKTIDYHHTHQYYRAVSLLEIPTLDYELVYSDSPLRLSGKNEPPSINKELPVVLKNNSATSDFDIYCSYVQKYRENLYIAYPINYYHTHTDNTKGGGTTDNDGYGTIGFWTSKDGRKFKEVKRDYITNNNNWMEFCIGHVETEDMYIHYYVPYDNTHGKRKNTNAIKARIHYKKKK